MTSLQKPLRADRLVEKEERKKARRSSPVRNQSGAALPRPEVWHNAKYRAWAVKRYGCAVGVAVHGPWVGRMIVKEYAHTEIEGKGIKASDNNGLVLCADHHREQHQIGWPRFEAMYGINRQEIARRIFESSPWFGKVEVAWA